MERDAYHTVRLKWTPLDAERPAATVATEELTPLASEGYSSRVNMPFELVYVTTRGEDQITPSAFSSLMRTILRKISTAS